MGWPDRLREEGKTEEEIASLLAGEGKIPEVPQNSETARRVIDEPDNGLSPYEPERRDEGWVHEDLVEPSAVAEEEAPADEE